MKRSLAVAGMVAAAVVGIGVGGLAFRTHDTRMHAADVRRALLEHPEMIAEALDRQRVAPVRAALQAPFASAWAGNAHGDVTLVMFTDYNCPYCRASVPAVAALLAADRGLKVVWRELPVLGPESEAAARVALAAARAGRYRAFHAALFAGDRPDARTLAAAAVKVGLDPRRLDADAHGPEVAAEIASNLDLARRMQIGATPFFVVGDRTFEGAIGADALARAIAEARRNG